VIAVTPNAAAGERTDGTQRSALPKKTARSSGERIAVSGRLTKNANA
jgi:hypothetical protein